jgi:hypothetical protein
MTRKNYEVYDRHGRLVDRAGDEELRDGDRLRVPLHMRDAATLSPMQREVMADKAARLEDEAAKRFGLSDGLDLHKPGSRYCSDTGNAAKAKAYADGVRDMCDAWKKPAGSGEVVGARPGDACMIDGQPGHLNARLQCVPDQRRADSVPPRTMTAADAQKIRDEAWLEMCRDLESAWKGPA